MPLNVEPLSRDLPFGKIVLGLTPEDIKDAVLCETLRRHWFESGLLVFRDSDTTEDFHIALSRVFGPLEVNQVREFIDGRTPELVRLVQPSGNHMEVDGEIGEYTAWHKDLVYADRINRGGILRALKPSSRGGLTGFIDQVDAYARLPERLQKLIENLRVVYQLSRHGEHPYATRSKIVPIAQSEASKSLFSRRDHDFPPVSHPLVFVHPETGRKILNYSPHHSLEVDGLGMDESHELLMTLANHIFDSPSYHHKWSTGEMLLWDNWRMVHMVSLVPVGEERVMHRTTIAGDYGLGRKAQRMYA